MTDKEIANFTRMADAFEEEIFKLRTEIETMKAKELETMERRMKDKVKIGELEKDNNILKLELEMCTHREEKLLDEKYSKKENVNE